MVLFTMTLLPLIFTILPLVMLYLTGQGMEDMGGIGAADVPVEFLSVCSSDMNAGECMQIYIVNQFLLLFMMMLVIIPVTIAAYSIVGEKAAHRLEPLLATPITTVELLEETKFIDELYQKNINIAVYRTLIERSSCAW